MTEGAPTPLNWLRDRLWHGWLVFLEALQGFHRDDGLRQASSLAFSAMLALLPALLLLTWILSLSVGSSQAALQRTEELVRSMLPQAGEVILREVSVLAQKKALGALNLAALFYSLLPLVGTFRSILYEVFKVQVRPGYLVAKLADLAVATSFLVGIAAVGALGILFQMDLGFVVPAWLRLLLPFSAAVLLLLGLFAAFTPRVAFRHLLAGSLVTAFLWALLRPAFTLFLTHNHGYGLAFGSLKSIFVVLIWVYYSQVVLLFGAEVMSALHRQEARFIRRFMEGKRSLAGSERRGLLATVPQGGSFFQEGEPGAEMFHILKGSVSIQRAGREIAVLGPGTFFGEMSFLLGLDRFATAVALEDCQCIVIHARNFEVMAREFPDTVRRMLVEMASRLRETGLRAVEREGEDAP